MSEAKHTPGPWHVCTIANSIGSVDSADGTPVAQSQPIGSRANPDNGTRLANTHLIAAAPDLLEALKRFDVDHDLAEGEEAAIYLTSEDQATLRAAIAKAEGRAT